MAAGLKTKMCNCFGGDVTVDMVLPKIIIFVVGIALFRVYIHGTYLIIFHLGEIMTLSDELSILFAGVCSAVIVSLLVCLLILLLGKGYDKVKDYKLITCDIDKKEK